MTAVRVLMVFAALINSVLAQSEGAAVNQSIGPPPSAFTKLLFPNGSNLLEYTCTAASQQRVATWARSSQTALALTNIVVLTNVGTVTVPSGHGLIIGNGVTVSGATVDTDLNGTYRLTAVTATTLVFTTASVANATYTESTLKITSTAPRTSQAIWDIEWLQYDGSSNTTSVQHAYGRAGMTSICDNRATVPFQ